MIGRALAILLAVLLAGAGLLPTAAAARPGQAAPVDEAYRIQEAASIAAVDPAKLPPRTIAFSAHRKDALADPVTGLVRFEDWERSRPVQKRALSLYPAYAEPTINVSVNGIEKPYKEKLHVFVAEARFVVPRPAASIDMGRYASLAMLERMDPSIRHRAVPAASIAPLTDRDSAHNRHPERAWCGAGTVCVQSRYQLEGKLPLGIRLANKLDDGQKKIADYMEFQSELRALPPSEIDGAALSRLTDLATPVTGVLEQSIVWVNQMMQFGKVLAVVQEHPGDRTKAVVTAFVALGIETDVLEKKKEFEAVPVLRNMVPAQVLIGNSSFNTGQSISAGLPDYARNRLKAIAAIMERE